MMKISSKYAIELDIPDKNHKQAYFFFNHTSVTIPQYVSTANWLSFISLVQWLECKT
jgi:hypothetical protein